MDNKKLIKCAFCDETFADLDKYADHLEVKHHDMIPPDMVPRQFIYYLKTKRAHGNCVMCKKKTTWNDKTNKYNRFCDNPKCKEEYITLFRQRMMDKYGKITLLNDPEQQRKMLANRKISGTYRWSTNPKYEFTYSSSYEKIFIEFLDKVMDMNPTDIFMPSPHTYKYSYEGKDHFYFPDMYIASLNLEIEIKDGGDNPNNHPKIQGVDKVKEKLKDDVMKSSSIPFNYLKVVDKKNIVFLHYLDLAKQKFIQNDTKKIVMM